MLQDKFELLGLAGAFLPSLTRYDALNKDERVKVKPYRSNLVVVRGRATIGLYSLVHAPMEYSTGGDTKPYTVTVSMEVYGLDIPVMPHYMAMKQYSHIR